MLFILKFLSLICLLLCTSCQNLKTTMGFDHSGPDEFDVTPLAPLSLPKDFNKTPSTEKVAQQPAENSATHADAAKESKPKAQPASSKPEPQDTAEIQSAGINTLAHESFEATHILIGSKGDPSAKTDSSVKIMLEETNVKPAVTPTSSPQDSKQDTTQPPTSTPAVTTKEAAVATTPDPKPLLAPKKPVKKLESHPIQEKEEDTAHELIEQEEKIASYKWTPIPDKEIQKHQEAVTVFNNTLKLEEEQELLEETHKQNAEKFSAVALPVQRVIPPTAQPMAQAPDKIKRHEEAFDAAAVPAKKNKKRSKEAMIADETKQNAEVFDTAATSTKKNKKRSKEAMIADETKQNAEAFDAAAVPAKKNKKKIKEAMIADETKQNTEVFDTAAAQKATKAMKPIVQTHKKTRRKAKAVAVEAATSAKTNQQPTATIAQAPDQTTQNAEASNTAALQKATKPAMKPIVQTRKKTRRKAKAVAVEAATSAKTNPQPTEAIAQAPDQLTQNAEASNTTAPQKATKAMKPIVQTPRKIKHVRKKKVIRKKQIRKKKPAVRKKRVVRRRHVVHNKKKYPKKKKRVVVYQTHKIN